MREIIKEADALFSVVYYSFQKQKLNNHQRPTNTGEAIIVIGWVGREISRNFMLFIPCFVFFQSESEQETDARHKLGIFQENLFTLEPITEE